MYVQQLYVTFGVFDVCRQKAAGSDRLFVLVMASPNTSPYLAASTAMLTGTNTGLVCATVTPCVAPASRQMLLRFMLLPHQNHPLALHLARDFAMTMVQKRTATTILPLYGVPKNSV